jgi:hypothetical protein
MQLPKELSTDFQLLRQTDNADENEAQLDEEMEKVFSEPGLSKFDVRKLSDIQKPMSSSKLDEQQPPSTGPHKYNEKDYDCKRAERDDDQKRPANSFKFQPIERNRIRTRAHEA